MKCPYCMSELNSQALVCKHCMRDIALPIQLMSRVTDLEEQLYALQIDKHDQHDQHNLSDLKISTIPTENLEISQNPYDHYRHFFFDFVKFFILPLLLLLLAHMLITVIYDTRILYLRLVTLILPLVFGFFLYHKQPRNTLVWLVSAVILGGSCVAGMSAVTSHVDHSPIWPQTIYVWRDFIEFAASITFSYITGMLLGRLSFLKLTGVPRVSPDTRHTSGNWLSNKDEAQATSMSLQIMAKKINEFTATIGAIVTTIVAIYTGLKGLF